MQPLETDFDTMAALKAGTVSQHKAIEQLMPFFKHGFSLKQYTDILAAFLGFFEPLENSLISVLGDRALLIDISHRMRAQLLRNDLRVLGLPTSSITAIPRCHQLPVLKDLSDGLGCLYVLEGSTLGGQLIARELSRCFNINANSGASFFLSHGNHTGKMWAEFCGAVRFYVNDHAKRQAAVASAQNTFTKLDQWIREAGFNAE
jgi:heme oxygenase (biliverdin-IX-beta and delta-forming)